jgi:hypothetical protein
MDQALEQTVLAGHSQEEPTVVVESVVSPEVELVQRMMGKERTRRPECVGWRKSVGKEDLDLKLVLPSVDEQGHEGTLETTDLMMVYM